MVASGVRVARSLVLCVVFFRSLFVLFLLTIVLSVLLQFTASECPMWCLQTFRTRVSGLSILNYPFGFL
jgi:hypothetical protein